MKKRLKMKVVGSICYVGTAFFVLNQYPFFNGAALIEYVSDASAASNVKLTLTTSSSCPSAPMPQPFDPFTGLTFSQAQEESKPAYSSFHCVGTGTRDPLLQTDVGSLKGRRPNFVSRSCWYRNLYYRHTDQTFHYFSSRAESNLWAEARKAGNESFQELSSKLDVSLGHSDDLASAGQYARHAAIQPWRPTVHENTNVPYNVTSVVGPKKAVFLLYQPFHSFNVGHFIWDDLLSIFSLLDLFQVESDDSLIHVPFFVELANQRQRKNYGGSDVSWRCSPWNSVKWMRCVKTYKKAYPELFGVLPDCSGDLMRTGNWLRGEDAIGTWKDHPKQTCNDGRPERTNLPPANSEYVLLPNVMAGTGRLNFFGCEGDCSVGRGPQWYRFRNFLLQKLFGPQRSCELELSHKSPVGYITFSLPIGSSRPNSVHWFEEEIRLAKQKYGKDAVRVANMSNMTWQEQAELIVNSAVLLTNHGGGGVVSMFLPVGSSAIVFWHDKRRYEHNFYESAGYFRTLWVSVGEREYVNRTMAMIEREVEKTALQSPGIISARWRKQK